MGNGDEGKLIFKKTLYMRKVCGLWSVVCG